jgi:hypothetical protein
VRTAAPMLCKQRRACAAHVTTKAAAATSAAAAGGKDVTAACAPRSYSIRAAGITTRRCTHASSCTSTRRCATTHSSATVSAIAGGGNAAASPLAIALSTQRIACCARRSGLQFAAAAWWRHLQCVCMHVLSVWVVCVCACESGEQAASVDVLIADHDQHRGLDTMG